MKAAEHDGPRPRISSRQRWRVRGGDVVVVLFFLVILFSLFRYDPMEILSLLYHPVAGLVLLVMLVEFLWLKSGDRTRIYRIEIDRLRRTRREDEELLRRAREVVAEVVANPDPEDANRPGDWRKRAINLRQDIDERL